MGAQIPDGVVFTARGTNGLFAPKSALNDWFTSNYQSRYKDAPVYTAYQYANSLLALKAAYDAAVKTGDTGTPALIKALRGSSQACTSSRAPRSSRRTPLATLRFSGCRVPRSHLIGETGKGFKMAMNTLDYFRASVGAAATGAARRALDETLVRVSGRKLFGTPMSEMDTVRMKIADMALNLDTAALLTYRAAWLKDTSSRSPTREIAMAKLGATEAAQRVVDAAVQLFGGTGVSVGSIIEQLYRDTRPMRIYEGASEIQKLIIGKRTLAQGMSVGF
ncbi:acyl-CoA dehydrogenase family protein [Variovorax sp. J31P207]|uniref:acyl-CoA dehydrogenase family protein n=1 Tax=Variovorax sp. J31P207 TaxID=3053510 RepID=UPI00257679EE|nr:acyl-CoA dehydrogenase family protein [Variovorax sp. J31P207]MDM0072735.1 acyl-CoA dehydrogenase family protein [Variovorax sp. J31P207]